MRTGKHVVTVAVVLAALTGGCSAAKDADDSKGAQQAAEADAWGDPPAAASAGKIGAACPLPVTFDLAGEWAPEGVEDGLFDQGGFDLRCEIDAKPAGHLGFLRVWTGPGTDPAAALETFVKAEAGTAPITDRRTRTTRLGDLPAVETTYLDTENERPERVLAVAAGDGIVILTLAGVDTGEHKAMLPAYVLARQTISKS
ncbi:lipoprotein [Actinoplanes sp. NPDC049596]|uniref:lipoprotein n=1 Tax=unclassified Actinoplanes TaxID=2626549 RepID=UPI003420945C